MTNDLEVSIEELRAAAMRSRVRWEDAAARLARAELAATEPEPMPYPATVEASE
jgi:hypothetical protein